MTNETAAGRMFVETASATLAARLLQAYCDSGSAKSYEPGVHRLDQARLRRFSITFNDLDKEITLAQLAGVAGLSVFHFARTFTRAVGVSPIAISAACAWRTRWQRSRPASCPWRR